MVAIKVVRCGLRVPGGEVEQCEHVSLPGLEPGKRDNKVAVVVGAADISEYFHSQFCSHWFVCQTNCVNQKCGGGVVSS